MEKNKNITIEVEDEQKFLTDAINRVCDRYLAKPESAIKRTSLRTFMKAFVDEIIGELERMAGKPIKLDKKASIEMFREIFTELTDAIEDDSDD